MGATFNTGYLENLILYNGSNNIGIGTSADATYKVTLGGSLLGTTANFNGNLSLQGAVTRNINFYDSSNTNINAQIQYDQITSNSGQLFFGTNNAGTFATRLTIANTGAATFSSSIAASGTISISTDVTMLRFGNLLRWGFQRPAADNRYVSFMRNMNATATPVWTVDGDNGNVGIGLNNPAAADFSKQSLDVSGPIIARGSLYDHQTSATVMQYYNGESWIRAYGATAGSGIIAFRTGGGGGSADTERMRITSGGNVGIGETNPSVKLHVVAGNAGASGRSRLAHATSGAQIDMYVGVSDGTGIIVNNNPLWFEVNGSERMRILSDATSTVQITGATANNDNYPRLRFKGGTYPDADSKYPYIQLGNGGLALSINSGYSATYNNPTQISLNNGVISFSTASNSSLEQRMEITSGGQVNIGGTDTAIWNSSSSTINQVSINSTDFPFVAAKASNIVAILNRTTSNGVILEFKYNSSVVGSISTNANSLPSDLNFKKDIKNMSLGLNLVNKLRPVHYRHKMDEDNEALSNGIIAQEMEQALLDCGIAKNSLLMLQHKPNNKENESQYWVDYTKMIPILTKAIQEQQAQIEELKSKLN